jgi:hypothetical protein
MLLQTCGAGRAETIWRRWRRLRAGAGAVVTGAFAATKGGRCGISRAAGGLRGKGRRAGTRELAGEGGGEEEGEGEGKTDEALRRWWKKRHQSPAECLASGPSGTRRIGEEGPTLANDLLRHASEPERGHHRSRAAGPTTMAGQPSLPCCHRCHRCYARHRCHPGAVSLPSQRHPGRRPQPSPLSSPQQPTAAHRSPPQPSPRQNRHRTYKLSTQSTPNAQ